MCVHTLSTDITDLICMKIQLAIFLDWLCKVSRCVTDYPQKKIAFVSRWSSWPSSKLCVEFPFCMSYRYLCVDDEILRENHLHLTSTEAHTSLQKHTGLVLILPWCYTTVSWDSNAVMWVCWLIFLLLTSVSAIMLKVSAWKTLRGATRWMKSWQYTLAEDSKAELKTLMKSANEQECPQGVASAFLWREPAEALVVCRR